MHTKAIPIQAWPGPWGSRRLSLPEFDNRGMKVALRTGRLYSPRKYSWYSFLLEADSTPRAIVRSEELNQWKSSMTSPGIEPATFRLLPRGLNQMRHRVPPPHLHTAFQNKDVFSRHSLRICNYDAIMKLMWIYWTRIQTP